MDKEEEPTKNPTITEENSKENCAVKSTPAEADIKSNPKPMDEENQEKLSPRVVTPALTSFPATFDSANIDENEMKDMDLYEDEDQADESEHIASLHHIGEQCFNEFCCRGVGIGVAESLLVATVCLDNHNSCFVPGVGSVGLWRVRRNRVG